jgi:hypothetical protein
VPQKEKNCEKCRDNVVFRTFFYSKNLRENWDKNYSKSFTKMMRYRGLGGALMVLLVWRILGG